MSTARIRPSTQLMPEGASADDALTHDGTKWAPGKVLRRILSAGAAVTQRAALNFTGAGVTATDDAVNGRTDITIPGYTDEQVRDVIGTAIVAGANVTVTVNDAGDTITIASAAGYTDEQVRDVIGAALVAGAGVTVTVNDAGDTITIASAVTQYTDEMARDALGAALVAGTGITVTVNDGADTITIASTGGGGGASALDDLTDADTTTTAPVHGDLLTYDAATSQWRPHAFPEVVFADDGSGPLTNEAGDGFIYTD